MHLFAAHELSPGRQDLMADEEIETVVLSWQEAMRLADGGEIADANVDVDMIIRRQHSKPGVYAPDGIGVSRAE